MAAAVAIAAPEALVAFFMIPFPRDAWIADQNARTARSSSIRPDRPRDYYSSSYRNITSVIAITPSKRRSLAQTSQRMHTMSLADRISAVNRLSRSFQWLADPLALLTRIYVSWVFLKSGWLKISDWDSTIFLFQEEYRVPLLPPHVAAVCGAAGGVR